MSEVLDDHVHRRRAGDLDGDLRNNYHPAVRSLSAGGVHHGHDGVRALAAILARHVSGHGYSYQRLLVDGELAMLQWSAPSSTAGAEVRGVDSYLVRDGWIVAQAVYCAADSTENRH